MSLAEHANDQGGSCFPCSATLRELTGLSERAIRMALRELESLGLIGCRRGRGKTSSRYRPGCGERNWWCRYGMPPA